MFHNNPSTGEPPTPPVTASDENSLPPNDLDSVGDMWPSSSHLVLVPSSSSMVEQSERGRSNTIPSHDSGYEMSPNLNQTNSQEFFTDSQDDCPVFEYESSDDELCSECDDDQCQSQLSHSSRTTVRSSATPSNIFCDNSESSSSFHSPPSSLPIAIPVANSRPSTTLPSPSYYYVHELRNREREEEPESMPDAAPLTSSRSAPVFPYYFNRSERYSSYHRDTLSSPYSDILRIPNMRAQIPTGIPSSYEPFFDPEPLDGDDDDDVFEEMEEGFSADFRVRLNSARAVRNLPDLLLDASPPQRTRSASVNIPTNTRVYRNIGTGLRSLCNEFLPPTSPTQSSERQQEPPSGRRSSFSKQLPSLKFLRKSDP